MSAESTKIKCPACLKELASRKGLPLHVASCKMWSAHTDLKSSEYNFDEYYKTGLYAEGLVEEADYVCCEICREQGLDFRKSRIVDHVRTAHKMTKPDYLIKYPHALLEASSVYSKRKATNLEKFGVENTFQSEELKEKGRQTNLERYGCEAPVQQNAEIRAKREATNLERYGATNPFASKKVQHKIRETLFDLYGTCNPQQVPEIRQKTQETNLRKYGDRHFMRTDVFKVKYKQTSLKRYGVEHPMQSGIVVNKLRHTFKRRYGVEWALMHPSVQKKAYATNLRNHGGVHSQTLPEVREKAKRTWMRTLGVDNPSKNPSIIRKIQDTWLRKYGTPLPPAWIMNYRKGPNKFEQRIAAKYPDYEYVGDGKVWLRMKSGRLRNPDFIKRDPVTKKITHVIEGFGDFWHSERITGTPEDQHVAEVTRDYDLKGISCKVIWESEI